MQGPDRVLAHGDDDWVGRLAERVMVSHRAHGSTQLVIASHSDCAGHPVDDQTHRRDLRLAAAVRAEVVVWRPEPVGPTPVDPTGAPR